MAALDTTSGGTPQVLRRHAVRQFVKFCIVGASSALWDFGIYLLLIEKLHLHEYVGSLTAARPLAQTISFLFAVTNGYVWNSRWTFHDPDRAASRTRFGKFVLTNVIGLLLNLLILTVAAHTVAPLFSAPLKVFLHDPDGFIGKLMATCVVVFWNFLASKYWTFRK